MLCMPKYMHGNWDIYGVNKRQLYVIELFASTLLNVFTSRPMQIQAVPGRQAKQSEFCMEQRHTNLYRVFSYSQHSQVLSKEVHSISESSLISYA